MTDRQYYAHRWLNRMHGLFGEIESWEGRREKILDSTAGISKYDRESFSSATGNASEAKMIEYSYLSGIIEEKEERLSKENVRTERVIDMIEDSPRGRKFKEVLIYRHINFLPWKEIAKRTNYSEKQCQNIHKEALEVIYDYIPVEAVEDED